ncbi:MAG TPA: hypothetical protein IAA53_01660 [Candidatus Avoscillospira avicola]|uniref:Uncharacterized protein n=1 Tax=Candidatus Avoscillospira avicola TaxID=2840706 RepID=A0A9D1ARZ3_9FIRM|nr:hypothetical protein [Candidatus Avoscillospira avicola]
MVIFFIFITSFSRYFYFQPCGSKYIEKIGSAGAAKPVSDHPATIAAGADHAFAKSGRIIRTHRLCRNKKDTARAAASAKHTWAARIWAAEAADAAEAPVDMEGLHQYRFAISTAPSFCLARY